MEVNIDDFKFEGSLAQTEALNQQDFYMFSFCIS